MRGAGRQVRNLRDGQRKRQWAPVGHCPAPTGPGSAVGVRRSKTARVHEHLVGGYGHVHAACAGGHCWCHLGGSAGVCAGSEYEWMRARRRLRTGQEPRRPLRRRGPGVGRRRGIGRQARPDETEERVGRPGRISGGGKGRETGGEGGEWEEGRGGEEEREGHRPVCIYPPGSGCITYTPAGSLYIWLGQHDENSNSSMAQGLANRTLPTLRAHGLPAS